MRPVSPVRTARIGAILALVATHQAFVATARADAADPLAARTLFADARKLMAQGKFEQACPKLEESLKLDAGIGTAFNLADCWEHIGRTASAWARFLDVATAARNAGQADREKVARGRAAALEPHLSRLTIIAVTAPDATIEVRKDRVEVGKALFGTAVPIDPGTHTIEAKAPGKKPWATTVQIARDATSSVTVPRLEDEALAIEPRPPSPESTPAKEGIATSHEEDRPGKSGHPLPWILGGIGVLGVAAGTVFALRTQSKNDEAKGLCPQLGCGEDEYNRHASLVDDAKSARTFAIGGFAVGGAALIGGAVLLLTSPKAAGASLQITPVVALGQVGTAVEGKW